MRRLTNCYISRERDEEKLQCVYQGIWATWSKGLHRLKASAVWSPGWARLKNSPPSDAQAGWPEVLELVRAGRQDAAQQGARLEALFRVGVAVDKAIALGGGRAPELEEKVVDFIMQGSVPWRKPGDVPEEVGSCFCARCLSGWKGGSGATIELPQIRKLVFGGREDCFLP